MPFDRREFIGASLAAASLAAAPWASAGTADRKLKILVLGGTRFLGPHTVRHAQERGHEVTLFNRGRTNAGLFPNLETIIGNRDPEIDKGLAGLEGREWDAVIDTSGYVPRITGASAGLLADSVGQYLFVSTICQYDNWAEGGTNGTEERPRATLDDPTTEDVSTHYCALKAYCERAVEEAMPGRVAQIRPGLIVGPRDGTDRFTYWPVRIDQGGEVLAPGKPSDLTQYIDVRDLARFMVHCLEQGLTDTYNVVRNPMPFGDLLSACLNTIDSDAKLTWVPADFLAAHDVQAWRDVPAWADSDSALAGSLTWSADKALAAGLTISPLEDTIRDTLAWFRSLPEERQATLRAGLSRDKEASVLEAWHSSGQAEGS
jgi:2'-hydroxyisoflavone reductase